MEKSGNLQAGPIFIRSDKGASAVLATLKQFVKNRFVKELYRPEYSDRYVTVFSHPRSGTHFLEAFLAENFYRNVDLSLPGGEWGHWANRKILDNGNPHGKLFGSHVFPQKSFRKIDYPVVYIYRDGRAVAYSVWRTENFIHPRYKDISFSDFLRMKLDWVGTPARKSEQGMTIAYHWAKHVSGWLALAEGNANILPVRYESLYDKPYRVYLDIHARFFRQQKILDEAGVRLIRTPVGLSPNSARIASFKEVFTREDNDYFCDEVQRAGMAADEYLIR